MRPRSEEVTRPACALRRWFPDPSVALRRLQDPPDPPGALWRFQDPPVALRRFQPLPVALRGFQDQTVALRGFQDQSVALRRFQDQLVALVDAAGLEIWSDLTFEPSLVFS